MINHLAVQEKCGFILRCPFEVGDRRNGRSALGAWMNWTNSELENKDSQSKTGNDLY